MIILLLVVQTLLNLDQLLAEVRTQVNNGDFELWVPHSNVSTEHVESARQNNVRADNSVKTKFSPLRPH